MIEYEKHHSSSINYIYRQYDTNLEFGSHFHDSFELIYVFEGEIIVFIEKEKYNLKKNQCLLILPNQIHSYMTETHSKTFILIFASSYVAKYYKQSLLYCAEKPYFNLDDKKIIDQLQNSDNTFLLKSNLYYIVYLYTSNKLISRDIKYNTLMQHVLTYIEKNYQENISLKNLAKELGYDYHYLSSIVNNGLNSNFLSYLNEYRINKVCELMMDDCLTPISDLAYSCGYTSLRTFNRNFLQIKKLTPSQYRQNLINN